MGPARDDTALHGLYTGLHHTQGSTCALRLQPDTHPLRCLPSKGSPPGHSSISLPGFSGARRHPGPGPPWGGVRVLPRCGGHRARPSVYPKGLSPPSAGLEHRTRGGQDVTLSTPPPPPLRRRPQKEGLREEVKVSLFSCAVRLPGEVEAEMFVNLCLSRSRRGRGPRAGSGGPGSLGRRGWSCAPQSYSAHSGLLCALCCRRTGTWREPPCSSTSFRGRGAQVHGHQERPQE